MKHVDARDLEKAIPGVVEALENGESLVVTLEGKTVGTLVPDAEARARRAAAIEAKMEDIRRNAKPTTIDEILAWRHEGHKY